MKLSEVSFDPIYSVHPEMPIQELVQILQKEFIRAVLVRDEGKILGMISDQVIFRSLSEGKDLLKSQAKDIMVKDCPTLDISTTVEDAYKKSVKSECKVFAIMTPEGQPVGEISQKRLELLHHTIEKTKIYKLEERLDKIKL